MNEEVLPFYEVIYLGGPSSSGKTTLAKALQDEFDDHFLHIGIDKMIGLMPAKLNDWSNGLAPDGFSWKTSVDQEGYAIREIQTGPFAQRICHSLIDVVVTLVKGNHFVIIDDVPLKQRHIDEWKQALQDFRVLYVGMSAPVNILEQREKKERIVFLDLLDRNSIVVAWTMDMIWFLIQQASPCLSRLMQFAPGYIKRESL